MICDLTVLDFHCYCTSPVIEGMGMDPDLFPILLLLPLYYLVSGWVCVLEGVLRLYYNYFKCKKKACKNERHLRGPDSLE